MQKLYVKKAVEIEAPAGKVWSALTKRGNTARWATEFANGGPELHLESDWNLGSLVTWKSEDGEVLVEGNVTAREANRFLRFTVFDVRSPRPPVSTDDGITYELISHNGATTLEVTQGDFSVLPEGEKSQHMTEEVWERVLPVVKEIAEH